MLRIFVVRPGSTVWDAERRIKGSMDMPLTAEGQAPVVVAAPAAPAAATVSVALPRLAPNTYTAAWTAESADGHTMSGSVSFMVH